jgi:hypothetical protein
MESEPAFKKQAVDFLKEKKAEYGSLVNQVRLQPFQVNDKSLLDQIPLIEQFVKNPFYRTALKSGIRDTNKNTHEWIPCQLMADCLTRDSVLGLQPGMWLLLQVHLRTATSGLIFDPRKVFVKMQAADRQNPHHNLRQPTKYGLAKAFISQGKWTVGELKPGDDAMLLQGHEGALKPSADLEGYQGDLFESKGWLSYGSSEFHNQLLYLFDDYALLNPPNDQSGRKVWLSKVVSDYLARLYKLADAWMWNPSDNTIDYAIAIPFKAHYGKGKERVAVEVDEDTILTWLDKVSDARKDTLTMIKLNQDTLPKVLG